MAQGDQQALRKSSPRASSPEELFRLGMICWLGQAVPRDLVEAHKWFNLAALAGDERARQYRRDISREMSPADIAEAQRQARSWLQSH